MNACMLCHGRLTDPEDIAPLKVWWPEMVTCTNPECIAFGIHVAADPEAVERAAYSNADRIEPKFAYSAGHHWFISTIYRQSSAALMDTWYYETHGYLIDVYGKRRQIYEAAAGNPRRALRVHALLSKRASRLYGSLAPA